jgi:polyphosphate kinase 2 (PPK2 family)
MSVPSEKQIAANKRNAAESTGPRTSQGKARSRMNALSHGSSSKIRFEQDFIARHLNQRTAATLNAELEPVRQQRVVLLTALDAAISAGKATATKKLLRKLKSLNRRELAIVLSSALPRRQS